MTHPSQSKWQLMLLKEVVKPSITPTVLLNSLIRGTDNDWGNKPKRKALAINSNIKNY